ncbi:recombinase family protein [Miniphocaeibacter massiliensis]|uniref:recombinase family protein n=1 Tax=Miniphocaeibacter massiliensis TaxID=2041841 RepID=UPI000C1B8BCC|nr:recombinase family protein [Miniphocaeibacter massiliensis]
MLFGYVVKNGEIKVNEEESEKIRKIFNNYLLGFSIQKSGNMAGLEGSHSSIGRILKNKTYLGDEFHPKIIDEEIFHKAQEEREKRKNKLGRNFKPANRKLEIRLQFNLKKIEEKYEEPFAQAEYVYSKIEAVI